MNKNLKDIVYVCLILAGTLTAYYANKGNTDTEVALLKQDIANANKEIVRINKTLEDNDLKLINYKLDQIIKYLKKDI